MNTFNKHDLRKWKLITSFGLGNRRYHQKTSGDEYWRRDKCIGTGQFGQVWREICVSGPSQDATRAVKCVLKTKAKEMSTRQLKALVTFSDPDVTEVDHSYRDEPSIGSSTDFVAVRPAFCPIFWLVRRCSIPLFRDGIPGTWRPPRGHSLTFAHGTRSCIHRGPSYPRPAVHARQEFCSQRH